MDVFIMLITHASSTVAACSTTTIPETGTIVTVYTTTAESVSPSNGIKVTLHERDLWAKFHAETTEMIITKAGRYVHEN